MQTTSSPLSVVIITHNEEANLPRCLSSLPKSCEIIIVDSGSTDKSKAIAESFGATVFANPFKDYASQKNLAIAKASRPWVLSLDADEWLSDDLRRDIETLISQPTTHTLFSLKRQLVFMDRTMRFGRTSDYPIRLFKRGTAEFNGSIHEVLTSRERATARCFSQATLFHYSYKNLTDYFAKFNRYTDMMAAQRINKGRTHVNTLALCARPPAVFFYRYILCLGVLDGYPGFVWSLLAGVYSFVKYAKLKELLTPKG